MFKEYDVVVINSNRISEIQVGTIATVLEVYGSGAYELEIMVDDYNYRQDVYFEHELKPYRFI